MKLNWRIATFSRIQGLLQLVLFLYTGSSATASFDSPRVVDPYTNTSPSGKFTCEVDPTDIYGRGDGKYRLAQNGSVIWPPSQFASILASQFAAGNKP